MLFLKYYLQIQTQKQQIDSNKFMSFKKNYFFILINSLSIDRGEDNFNPVFHKFFRHMYRVYFQVLFLFSTFNTFCAVFATVGDWY